MSDLALTFTLHMIVPMILIVSGAYVHINSFYIAFEPYVAI